MSGDILRYFRVARNLTQERVAEVLEVSQSTYSDLENNKLRLKEQQAEKLAELYDVSKNVFLDDRSTIINQKITDHSRAVMYTENYLETDKELVGNLLNRIDLMLEQMQNDRKEQNEEKKRLLALLEKLAGK